ncbi:hypothetical protein [Aurantiacibacter suaedae]|uniref:hypothetical protein n=1 Tax=Aurantiacibacter suaedae TaxID=2545755 RepID=UPI0010F85B4B|nr:hypothetical protein [Aurantiacibacter suaedae]
MSGLAASALGACSSEPESPAATASQAPSPASAPPAGEAPGNARVPLASDTKSAQATTLCADEERAIFSCKVRGGKVASVCLAKGGEEDFAQYRFGRADTAPELVWPTNSSEQLAWASTMYSGGGETQVSFATGDVRYVVYSKAVRTNFAPGEPNDPAFSDGVAVLRAGKVQAKFVCEGADLKPIDVEAARDHLEEAPDLFTYDID